MISIRNFENMNRGEIQEFILDLFGDNSIPEKFIIQENINTCEDMIEWMNYDVEMYADSNVFDTYILNLETRLIIISTGF